MSEILLDSQAFFHNLTYISKYLHTHSTSTKLALVLKDNAYGHGLRGIASLAREFGVQDVFVKTYDEAQVVREFFSSITILYGEPKGALAPNMAIAINNKEILHSLTFGSKVELKVNTGMNRNGITQNGLQLFGVFTHNGYGDDLGDDFKIGCENFENIKTAVLHICKKLGIEKPRFHGLNSSGTLRSQTITDDLVRVGIGAYGYLQSDATPQIAHALKPVASLWADRISSKILPKGTSFEFLTQWDVNLIVNHINSTPRKSLNGSTPYDVSAEVYGEEVLKKPQLRRIDPDEVKLSPKLIRNN